MATTYLWERIETPIAKSIEFKLVRCCLVEEAEQWLKIFQKDEPHKTFVLATKKPRGKKGIKIFRGPGVDY